MKLSDLVVVGLALFLMYQGYNRGKEVVPVDGDVEVILEYEAEVFPVAPTDPETLRILSKLDALKLTSDESLLLARAYEQWAHQVANDTRILDLTQLAKHHKDSAEDLLYFEQKVAGKYGGKINEVIKELYNYKLSFLKDNTGRISTTSLGAVGSPVRKALQDWMNSISWKMSDIFLQQIPDNNT